MVFLELTGRWVRVSGVGLSAVSDGAVSFLFLRLKWEESSVAVEF